MFQRQQTKNIHVGEVSVGGGAPVSVQSMTKTDTRNVRATLNQIEQLRCAGCEIVRCAVPDTEAVDALRKISTASPLPVVADIHFDYRLALGALEAGVQKLRINPGNIGARWKVKEVALAAKDRAIPIRIGVNSGSLPRRIIKTSGITPEGMVKAALEEAEVLISLGFEDIVLSLKASSVSLTIESYRLIAKECLWPLHVGVTEAGTFHRGTVKSAVGIGTILAEGIGDTIRVSLTGDPVEEVRVGYLILGALDLRKWGPDIISCPTCGRTEIDVIGLVQAVEDRVQKLNLPVTIAVMGCVVNGPGEARKADYGIAGGKGFGLLFRKGRVLKKLPESELVDELFAEIMKDLDEEHMVKKDEC